MFDYAALRRDEVVVVLGSFRSSGAACSVDESVGPARKGGMGGEILGLGVRPRWNR